MSFPETLVILAALNEEEGIGLTLAELQEVLGEPSCLVVDGHSTDGTVEIARKLGARVLTQSKLGKGRAISEALDCVDHDPKYVVFIDADFTYPAKSILEMVQILEETPNAGMVTGNRFNPFLTPGAMKNPFYAGNRLLAMAHKIFNGVDLDDPLTGLRVVRWKILKGWKPRSKGFDVEAEMNYVVERQGYQIIEIPTVYRERLGEKKLKLRHGFAILRRIILDSLRYHLS